jgi:glycerate 2-kinase
VKDGQLTTESFSISLSQFERIFVLAVGKASALMMYAAMELLGEFPISGMLVVPKDQVIRNLDSRVQLLRADHPIPDRNGLDAARRVTEALRGIREDEMLFCLISGGASAMLPSPPAGISLQEERRLTQLLLASEATIREINTVRRHLSTLKGGLLVQQCRASTILALIMSDVPGNHLPDIASGLTAEDPTTYQDAIEILEHHELWVKVPQHIKKHLTKGLRGQVPETPKPGTASFQRVRNVIIADNRTASDGATRALRAKGVQATILTSSAEISARHMGNLLASLANGCKGYGDPFRGSGAVIVGGECTVRVKERGIGGRNQEAALSAAQGIAGLDGVVVAALGTDGIDGNSKAAGALVDGRTAMRAKRKRLDLANFLARNDSHRFFRALNDNLVTGRTGTNVGDLYLMISLE